MKKHVLGLLLAINVIWAGSYSATKVLMADAPFYLVTSIRYLIAAVPMLLYLGLRGRGGFRMSPHDFFTCLLMGIATFTLCPVLMYAGVGLSRAADAAILTSTEPLLVSMGAFLYLREKLTRSTVVGLLIATGGALVMSEFWNQSGSINPLGTALIFCGVFFEAWYSVLGKELLSRHDPLKVATMAIAAACLVNVIAVSALGMWPLARAFSLPDWLLLAVYLSFLCTLVGYTVWFVALQTDAASRVAITIFTQPVIGLIIAWIWVHEIPTTAQLAGTSVILAGVSVALFGSGKKRLPSTGPAKAESQ